MAIVPCRQSTAREDEGVLPVLPGRAGALTAVTDEPQRARQAAAEGMAAPEQNRAGWAIQKVFGLPGSRRPGGLKAHYRRLPLDPCRGEEPVSRRWAPPRVAAAAEIHL
jgi:hypothetical protein